MSTSAAFDSSDSIMLFLSSASFNFSSHNAFSISKSWFNFLRAYQSFSFYVLNSSSLKFSLIDWAQISSYSLIEFSRDAFSSFTMSSSVQIISLSTFTSSSWLFIKSISYSRDFIFSRFSWLLDALALISSSFAFNYALISAFHFSYF